MYIVGRIHEVKSIQLIEEGKIKKREFILQIGLNNLINMTLMNANTSLTDGFYIGDEVIVEFLLKGRKFKDKVFNTLEVKSIKPKDICST